MSTFNNDVVLLVENMVDVFQRKQIGKRISERITRGRSSASACEFEEELAKLIEKHTPEDIRIYVDSPLSYSPPESIRAKTIYLDLALVRAESLICIVEAKIDLGYLDPSWAQSRKEIHQQLVAVGKVRIGKSQFGVSQRLTSAGVVLSGRNHPERLASFTAEVENAVILLSRKHLHPNDRMEGEARNAYIEGIGNDEVHQQQWGTLERFLQEIAATASALQSPEGNEPRIKT